MECDRKLCKIAQNCPCKCVPNAKKLYCTPKKKLETIEDLKVLLTDCLADFWERDSDLIKNKVYEPVISGKFAMILQKQLYKKHFFGMPPNIDIDIEYDKHLQDAKIIGDKCKYCSDKNCRVKKQSLITEEKKIRPDIVFHERINDNNNICAFEIKCSRAKKMKVLKYSTYKYDYAKLKALVCGEYEYKYTWGIHLTFFEKGTVVQIFKNNEISRYKYDKTTEELSEMK